MKKVCDDHEPVIITRQKEESVVMLSLEDFRALEETAYLLRVPKNARRLLESIAELEPAAARPANSPSEADLFRECLGGLSLLAKTDRNMLKRINRLIHEIMRIRSQGPANPNRSNTAFPATGHGASTTSTASFTDPLKMLSLLLNCAIITDSPARLFTHPLHFFYSSKNHSRNLCFSPSLTIAISAQS